MTEETFDPADVLTAFHEAGHAIIALVMGRDVHRVSIIPAKTRLGHCELKKGASKTAKDWLESEVLILLAGVAAEGRLTGQYCWSGAARDLKQARMLTESRAGSAQQAERLEKRMLDKVEHLLDMPEHWEAIQSVARELLMKQTVSGRAARHYYQMALAKAEKNR